MIDVDERAAGQVAIHDDFEDVVVKTRSGEVPVVVEPLVQEIQTVETLHPTDPHPDVEVFRVVIQPMALFGVHELVHADSVTLGHDRPVVDLGVHARNLIGRELKDLERDVLALERERRRDEKKGDQKTRCVPASLR